MAARAIWKGSLVLGRQRVPVKLYSAVQDQKVHFHLLHAKDGARVEQRMVDPESGEVVPYGSIRKGYEDEGVMVALEEEELAGLEPEPSRDVELTRFVPVGAIDHQWYDRPYWVGPDGDEEAYFGLVAALRRQEREGVARWVMRKRPYAGALRVEGEHLMLIALRHAGEVVLGSELEAPGGRALDARERKLAEQLVEALAGPFDASEYRDTYRDEVRKLIEAKAAGKRVRKKKAPAPRRSESLEKALAASLARARGKGGGGRKAGARRRAAG